MGRPLARDQPQLLSHPPMPRHLWPALCLALFSLVGSGCDDACSSLNRTICDCEPTDARKDSCNQRRSSTSASPTDADTERCEMLIDTCTCDALADGRLDACGLALECALPADQCEFAAIE
jgi:hypothetical protein